MSSKVNKTGLFVLGVGLSLVIVYAVLAEEQYEQKNYPVGLDPRSVATGDFNGDGISDLVVANYGSNTVSVLLWDIDGRTFASARDFTVGTNPISVAVGDFNQDGILDLAVANEGSNDIAILLGNFPQDADADGDLFQEAQYYPVGPQPSSVAVGDFRGNNILDLAVGHGTTTASVGILQGNGDGMFQPESCIRPVAMGTQDPKASDIVVQAVCSDISETDSEKDSERVRPSITVGDFDKDGKLDLAVTNPGTSDQPGRTISVYFGKGDGTFDPAANLDVGQRPSSIAAGNFARHSNNILDLAVANAGSNNVWILLNNGNRTFTPLDRRFPVGPVPVSIVTGDFDFLGRSQDTLLDLITVNNGSPTASILFGTREPTLFEAARSFGSFCSPTWGAVGYFNVRELKAPYLAVTGSASCDLKNLANDGGGQVSVYTRCYPPCCKSCDVK